MGCGSSNETDIVMISPFQVKQTKRRKQCTTCSEIKLKASFRRNGTGIIYNECEDCFRRRCNRWQHNWSYEEGRRQVMIAKALGRWKGKEEKGTQTQT